MLIAQEKRKTNVAEYILYMWQIEDIIRACKFDLDLIKKQLVSQFEVSEKEQAEIADWYDNLLHMMKVENVKEKGHLQVVQNMVDELTDFHFFLLHKKKDARYIQLFSEAAQGLLEMRNKSQAAESVSDVEVGLTGLYGMLMLRVGGREVTKETAAELKRFGHLIAYLSKAYLNYEQEPS